MFRTVTEGIINDEIDILVKINVPILVIFGEEEKICNTNYLTAAKLNLWGSQVYIIENSGHL